MRVVVGFFGITRSLRFTIGSIQANILAPLRETGVDLVLAGHFHLPALIDNPRSGEIRLAADPDEAALLRLDRCVIEPQEYGLIERDFHAANAYPDILQDGYASVRNLCFQLRSLDRLWALMAPDMAADDWAVFLRPDLHYFDRIDVPALIARMRAEGEDIAVPSWHSWGGLNDRFAVANRRAAEAYATRLRLLDGFLASHGGLHGERLLAAAAAAASLRIADLPARAVRIRAGGAAEPRDLEEFALPPSKDGWGAGAQRTTMASGSA